MTNHTSMNQQNFLPIFLTQEKDLVKDTQAE